MQLFILRHGHSELQKTTDEARNLTAKGREDVALSVIKSLQDLQSVTAVWQSTLVRAQQTAQIAIELLQKNDCRPTQKITDLIVPEANPYELFDELLDVKDDAILLVSHQPFVGQLIDLLCGASVGTHPMDTSSLACIDCELPAAGLGRLRWLRHVNG